MAEMALECLNDHKAFGKITSVTIFYSYCLHLYVFLNAVHYIKKIN